MKKYYYQIKEKGKDWETIKPSIMEFKTREEAVNFAADLSRCLGMEIRLTDNINLNQASYFTPN